jgi:hypothetical protein
MQRRVISTSAEPRVIIDTPSDLRLMGGELNEVYVEGSDSIELTESAEGVRVFSADNCTVRVPRRAQVEITHVGGDARIKTLDADLSIKTVGGDLVLRQTATTRADHVGGDVSAKKIAGSLAIDFAGGDISARGVAGPFAANQVGGDLYLREAEASAQGQAGGDVVLNTEFHPGQAYQFEAGGDILVRVPSGASVKFEIEAGGDISVDVPDAQLEGEGGDMTVTIAGGAAQVSLAAGSDVSLSDVTTDTSGVAQSGDDFGDRLAAHIEARLGAGLAAAESLLDEQLTHFDVHVGSRGMNAEKLAAQARKVEEAARRKAAAAERKAEAIRRKADAIQRKAEKAAERVYKHQAKHGRHSWGWNFNIPTPPTPPRPPRPAQPPVDPVSDEERLTILRLLEQGKITAADAEKLLAALEGKT